MNYHAKIYESLGQLGEVEPITVVDGGHANYYKNLVSIDGQTLFAKSFAPDIFTDPVRRAHSRAYLKKEYDVMRFLTDHGASYIPANIAWLSDSDTLVEEAFPPGDGWHWEAPSDEDTQANYIEDVMEALYQKVAADDEFEAVSRHDSLQEYYDLGWTVLESSNTRQATLERLNRFRQGFLSHVQDGAALLERILTDTSLAERFQKLAEKHLAKARPNIGHYDARQSNIAWHSDHGARLADWSWAAPAPANSDKTMFIIDLFKSEVDVTNQMPDQFDAGHAAMLIGLWLGRSTAPTVSNSIEVRFHQLASAASAATLLS